MMVGGGSIAAARRAGRFGLALLAQANPAGLREAYEEACRAVTDMTPVMASLPEPGRPDRGVRRTTDGWTRRGTNSARTCCTTR